MSRQFYANGPTTVERSLTTFDPWVFIQKLLTNQLSSKLEYFADLSRSRFVGVDSNNLFAVVKVELIRDYLFRKLWISAFL